MTIASENEAQQASNTAESRDCTLQGELYYADSDLCDPDVDKSRGYPARPIDPTTRIMEPWPEPFVLMVDRGDCSFAEQVRNAQEGGAIGVLIAGENSGGNGDQDEEIESLLADDESSRNIRVPSYYIQNQVAGPLKEAVMSNQTVTLEMAWNVLKVDLFHLPSPYRNSSVDIPYNLQVALQEFKVKFTPYFYIVSAEQLTTTDCNTIDNNGATLPENEYSCEQRCSNFGRYCVEDPDNMPYEGVSGIDIIEESIRRKCIWDVYGRNNTDLVGLRWWNYVNAFHEDCTADKFDLQVAQQRFNDNECIRSAMQRAGLSYVTIERCVLLNTNFIQDEENDILEENRAALESMDVMTAQKMFINSLPYSSETFTNALDSICDYSRSEGWVPHACLTCADCTDPYNCLLNGVCLGPIGDDDQRTAPPTTSETLPKDESESLGVEPPTLAPAISTDNENEEEPSSNAPQTEDLNTGPDNDDDESDSGLSDNAKVVIVVGVVGGIIMLIFAGLLALVWKLLMRIRELEKNEKRTRTTSSPLDSFVIDIPYFGDHDQCFGGIANNYEVVLNEPVVVSEPALTTEPVEAQTALAARASPILQAIETENKQEYYDMPQISVVESHEQTSTTALNNHANGTRPENSDNREDEINFTGDLPDAQFKPNVKDKVETKEITAEAAAFDPPRYEIPWWQRDVTNKADSSSGKEDNGPQQEVSWWQRLDASDKSDASVVEIMGKAAPEHKVNRVVYEDEEKSEIEPEDQ